MAILRDGTIVQGDETVTGSLNVTGAISGATVNTGQGANELYPMDQSVKKADSPKFANATIGGHNIDSELDTLNSRVNQDVRDTASPTFASVDTGFGANEVFKTSYQSIEANGTTSQLSAMDIGEVRYVYYSCTSGDEWSYLQAPAGGNFYISPVTNAKNNIIKPGGSFAGNTNFAEFSAGTNAGVFFIRRNS